MTPIEHRVLKLTARVTALEAILSLVARAGIPPGPARRDFLAALEAMPGRLTPFRLPGLSAEMHDLVTGEYQEATAQLVEELKTDLSREP